MNEKRRYGELILHRVTAPKSNAAAKEDAADIRIDGYRARIDTWQGQFAVWSDKGLTDATMPTRRQRAASGVKRGRRTTSTSAQRTYDEASKGKDYPPTQFSFEERIWGWYGTAWGADEEKEKKRKTEVFTKQGYDVLWLRFRGGIPVLYLSKWKDGKKRKPKHAPEDYTKVTGHGKKTLTGVSGKLRGKRAPKTVTHKGKKWKLDSCHLRMSEAKSFATALSDDNHTVIFQSGVGSYCIYIRTKSRKKLDKPTVEAEVFAYLDRLHRADVSREKLPSVLVQMYGMSESSAKTFVRRWGDARQLDVKPATHEHRRGISKGVYTSKAEIRTIKGKRTPGKPSVPSPKSQKLVDTTVIGGKSSMIPSAENLLGIRVDEVLAVRQFGKKNILIMVRIGKSIKIYELLRGRTKKTKHKFTERNLLDRFSTRATKSGVERAFRKEAARRGIT